MYIGEIVGRVGVFAVKKLLPALKKELVPDIVVANADGVTGGSGVGKMHAMYLRKMGIDVLCTGEGAFYKKDILDIFPTSSWLLRPLNYPSGVPGRGVKVLRIGETSVAIVAMLGQSGFSRVHLDNPFLMLDELLPRLKRDASCIIIDFHAGTTAEKNAFALHADGKVSAVIGSHVRTLTADARILPKGTAFITDAGRTGSMVSVGGLDAQTRIQEYLSGIPVWAKDAVGSPELQGIFLELRPDGSAESIKTLRLACKEAFNEGTGNSDKN